MHQLYYGDNLPILREHIDDESMDMIYIDPPFNTGKLQKRTTIHAKLDSEGDRIGFHGMTYRTSKGKTTHYVDKFADSEDYLAFLRPRFEEAYRVLRPHGSFFLHIDYREVHYCKVMLDEIFGRDSFMNEIIWSYDLGGDPSPGGPRNTITSYGTLKRPNIIPSILRRWIGFRIWHRG